MPVDDLGAIMSGFPFGELDMAKTGNRIGSDEVRGLLVSSAMEDARASKGLLRACSHVGTNWLLWIKKLSSRCIWIGCCCICLTAVWFARVMTLEETVL